VNDEGAPRLDRLWAGWRSTYVSGEEPNPVPSGTGTIFERILQSGLPDEESYVLWRGTHCAALLNAYPYSSGHLMVLPIRAAHDLLDLEGDAYRELWDGVRLAVEAIRRAYAPDGVNVGVNLGRAGGASIPDHLHVHCLPRWAGDTTFLTSVAETRMLPETLSQSWQKLRAAWPRGPGG
jgi:ATP adenylyltransferase